MFVTTTKTKTKTDSDISAGRCVAVPLGAACAFRVTPCNGSHAFFYRKHRDGSTPGSRLVARGWLCGPSAISWTSYQNGVARGRGRLFLFPICAPDC